MARVDRVLAILSDIEMGPGGRIDDFPHDELLAEILLAYNDRHQRGRKVDVVFNGDTFDFLKTSVRGEYAVHVDAGIALEKLDRISRAHGRFFEVLRELLSVEDRRVFFIAGNHDYELLFPEVQREITARIGHADRVFFPGLSLDLGEVHIEHGSQGDPVFRIDSDRPFTTVGGRRVLNLPWGAVGVLEIALPLHAELHHLERIKPRDELFAVLPEARELLLQRSWRYWTRDYWRSYARRKDPLRTVSWPMIKEIASRLFFANADVSTGDYYQRALESSDRHRLFVVGHTHEADRWASSDRALLRTGCLRNEYRLEQRGEKQVPLPKIHGEVLLEGDRVRGARLIQREAPPDPPGYLPSSIFELRPVIRALLEKSPAKAAA
jgi:UDP-2,3-diacylglucosamine pyrophosphatase LpxH